MTEARRVLVARIPSHGDEAALALAKECPAEVTAIGAAMGKSRGPDGKWA